MQTTWRRIDDVFPDERTIDRIRPDANVVTGYMLLAYVLAHDDLCEICHFRPRWQYTPKCHQCYGYKRRHGADWGGRLFKYRHEGPMWPLRRHSEFAENQ